MCLIVGKVVELPPRSRHGAGGGARGDQKTWRRVWDVNMSNPVKDMGRFGGRTREGTECAGLHNAISRKPVETRVGGRFGPKECLKRAGTAKLLCTGGPRLEEKKGMRSGEF